jgi:hypothetical protein
LEPAHRLLAPVYSATVFWRAAPVAVMGSLAAAGSAAAFDPATEARNFSKTTERAAIYGSLEGQLLLRRVGIQNALASR